MSTEADCFCRVLRKLIMAKKIKIGRDAKTGKFITVAEAKRRPNTTVIETVKKKKK